MIKQFVPQEFCLKCQGCCRFKEDNSVWSPCLLDEEILELIDREGIPAASLTIDRRLQPIANPSQAGFICPFLGIQDNKCKIYNLRPFECQLYPFLINLRKNKVILTVDLNCPYAYEKIEPPRKLQGEILERPSVVFGRESINSQEAKDYITYLANHLNSPEIIEMLKNNPQIIQAYEEVWLWLAEAKPLPCGLREVAELNFPHETK